MKLRRTVLSVVVIVSMFVSGVVLPLENLSSGVVLAKQRKQDNRPVDRTIFGLDYDGARFAQMDMGQKARFTSINPSQIRVEIIGNAPLGEIEFIRLDRVSTVASFKVPTGDTFCVRTLVKDADSDQGRPLVLVWFKYKDTEVLADSEFSQRTNGRTPPDLSKMLTEVNTREDFSELLRWVPAFMNESIVSRIAAIRGGSGAITADAGFDCLAEMTECFVAAAAYLGGIGALISLCGISLGLSCIGAILLHPILALNVGVQCTQAAQACGLAN